MRLFGTLAAAAVLISTASTAEAAQRHRFNLPGGRLGDALVALGRQSGISIGVSDSALANQTVPPVRGTLTVEQALNRLLRRTGARPIVIDSHTIRIVRQPVPQTVLPRARPAPPRPAPPRAAAVAPPLPEEVEIVVTATKRPVRLTSYPGPVTIVGGEDPALQDAVRGSEALVSRLPGLTSTHLGPGRNKLFIRGIADSSFSGPTQATVGQYLGETRLNYNAPDPDLRLYDLDRVEVLYGPQGTLYGAGSLGGIIRIVPNVPQLDSIEAVGSLGASYTQHGDPGIDAAGMLNLPLAAGRLGLRLVGYGISEGGYIDDAGRGLKDVNRTRIAGGRATLRGEVEGWIIDLGATAQHIRGEDAQFADRDGPPLTRKSAVAQYFTNDYFLAHLVATKEWGDLRFVTALGLVQQTLSERYDSTRKGNAPVAFDQVNRVSLLSAESRLSRQGADGAGWLVGASVIANRSDQSRAIGPPEETSPLTGVRNIVAEGTVYGEGTVRLLPGVTASAGGRFTYSRLSGPVAGPPPGVFATPAPDEASRTQSLFLPSAALAARAGAGLLFFLRYQEGFRPGGLTASGSEILRFQHDKVATAEAGFRYSRSGARQFNAALSLAFTRWTDVQADVVNLDGNPFTANIGDGRIYTLDVTLGWRPLSGLEVELSALFNDSQITDPETNASLTGLTAGSPLPNVARINGRLGAEYRTSLFGDGSLRLSGAARYVGKSILGIGEVLDEEQGNWLDITLGARVETGRHAITAGVTNLLDSGGNRFALGSPYTLAERRQITPLRPRTVRVAWELRF